MEVKGVMTKSGADRVGNKLANAVLIMAIFCGAAAVIHAVKWW